MSREKLENARPMKIAVRVSPPRRSGTIDGQRHVCVHTFIAPQSLLYSTIRTLCSLHVCNHESATMNRARPTFDRTLCMHGVTNRQPHAFILFCSVPPSVSHICHHQAQSQKTRSLIKKSWVWFSLSLLSRLDRSGLGLRRPWRSSPRPWVELRRAALFSSRAL